MTTEWTELSYLQKQSSKIEQFRDLQQNPFSAFALGVVLVFFVLAGLYESWSLPLAVILVVPMCLSSALAGVALAGMDVNIFVQVGFVVLVGLAAKNAILIVEFARDRQEEGATGFDAAVEAARVRLRPILMTSFAFILGVFPLVIAHGAGAEMRRTLGTAVFAGMIGRDPLRHLPHAGVLLRHPPRAPGTHGRRAAEAGSATGAGSDAVKVVGRQGSPRLTYVEIDTFRAAF